jgi:hypothetical protein
MARHTTPRHWKLLAAISIPRGHGHHAPAADQWQAIRSANLSLRDIATLVEGPEWRAVTSQGPIHGRRETDSWGTRWRSKILPQKGTRTTARPPSIYDRTSIYEPDFAPSGASARAFGIGVDTPHAEPLAVTGDLLSDDSIPSVSPSPPRIAAWMTSDSEDSSIDSEAEGPLICVSSYPHKHWFVQPDSRIFDGRPRSMHWLHFEEEAILGGGYVPYCRDEPFRADPAEAGIGLASAATSACKEQCVGCLRRMPLPLREAILRIPLDFRRRSPISTSS